MVRHALLGDAEGRLSQRLCERCKAQPSCLILDYNRGLPTRSKRNPRHSREVCQLCFLEILHKVIICESIQMDVIACDQSGRKRAFLEVELAAMPCRDVELLEKRCAVRDAASILVPLAREKKRERRAIGVDGTVVGGREAETIEGRL